MTAPLRRQILTRDYFVEGLPRDAKLTRWQVRWLLLNGQLVQGDGRQPG